MKKIFLAVLLTAVFCTSAFALSDREYGSLLRENPEFYDADQELNGVWDELKDVLSAREFARLKQDQADWVKSGRDRDARRRMKAGRSKARAYTEATRARAKYLRENYLDY
ncbi:MAG: DUF1311 domain-containing protein [Synergistaceae bacterium]|nr:DUF1311 domain-containing protein [Synergistaceae bacterium]